MARHDLSVIGALVATGNLDYDDAKAIEAYCEFVDTNEILPISVESAIGSALEFFEPPADVAAAAVVAARDHNHDRCPDCGGPMENEGPDDHDFAQALALWDAVRSIADKYAFDRCDFTDGGRDIEEC